MTGAKSLSIAPETFQLIFEAWPGLHLILLPDAPRFTIAQASKAFLSLTGTTGESLTGQSIDAILNESFAHSLRHSLEQVLHTRAPHQMGSGPYGSAGFEERHWSARNTPVCNDKGQVIYIIHTVTESTEMRTAELEQKVQERTAELARKNEDLLQQKEFVEVILDSSLILVSVFDTDTRIIAFNRKGEETFGVKREQVIGKKFTEAFPGIEGSLSYNSLLRALKGESIHNAQFRSVVNGRYFESYLVPLRNEAGEVFAVLVTAHDITDIVESAEKLQAANEELLRTNSELEQFAYVASHDLQEPLRKIQTFIGLLQAQLDGQQPQKGYAEKIHASASRMSRLIRDVLNYSGMSATAEQFAPVPLKEVIGNIRADFELLIEEKQAELQYTALPVVKGIPIQLHQLFANLMSNALKFSTGAVTIRIEASELSPEALAALPQLDQSRTYTVISFADNGIGFEQQYAEKIFGIFQRLDNRTGYKGTGIGLALCKKIAENHGGAIVAKSEPGKGATFFIYLPAAQ